jgi:predicted dehydrogenase
MAASPITKNHKPNMRKIKWGVISTAKIAREKVIPAMQAGVYSEVVAIASAHKEQAQPIADRLKIPVVYGSYQELLDDKTIEAVYIPLPNHLHVEWAIKCLQAGKHVLCEKPLALSSGEAEQLLSVSRQYPSLKIMEAFMYRFHPQWQHAKKLVDDGTIGELKTIQSFFSYFNTDPANIRNQPGAGGGGMMDIGCYCVSLSRFIFGKEPLKVNGFVDYDPVLKTDRLASGLLQFDNGVASFTCSTQAAPYQRVNIIGTSGRIEIEIPFNAPPDKPTRSWLHAREGSSEQVFEIVDQYTLQGDLFSRSILDNSPVPTPLEDAVKNMKAIEALIASGKDEQWKKLA